MQSRSTVLAVIVFLAIVPGLAGRSVGKNAEKDLYPDPRKNPKSCGRLGLTTTLLCDPTAILKPEEADRVDVVARSLRNDGMNVALALVKGTGSPKKGDEFTCGDAAKGMTQKLLTEWANGLNVRATLERITMLVLLSVEDSQFCVAQRDTVRPLTAEQEESLYDNMSQILQAQQHVTSINLVESALTTALLKLRGAFLHNQKVPGTKTTSPPSTAELLKVVVAYMIPFIGFGVTDNGLMIIFGEAIEKFLGARLGLSTMGAAATGNLLSDIAGIALGGTIQTYASYIGAEEPDLSKAQRETSAYRLSKMFGESFGISIGCWIGMAPLLFIEEKPSIELCEEPAAPLPTVKSFESFTT